MPFRLLALLLLLFSGMSLAHASPLRVVATTTDLAAIAQEVGGDLVAAEALVRADQDPHAFEILPRQMLAVQDAAVFLTVGLGLDAWAGQMVQSADNRKLVVVDCSRQVPVIHDTDEHRHGHGVHPGGNPHYWLGPSNFRVIGETIHTALIAADPVHAAEYAERFDRFAARADSALTAWRGQLNGCSHMALVTMHPSWDYFARDFGLPIAGTVSRSPEAEPAPADLARLEQTIRQYRTAIFLQEPFTSDRMPAVLQRDTKLQVMTAPSSVGSLGPAGDLWSHFDYLVRELARRCRDGQ